MDELRLNGRITNIDLAGIIGLSPSATLRRIRALEESGIISGYTVLYDPSSLGHSTTVFVEIALSGQSAADIDAFEAAVVDCPGIVACHLMAGNFDYLVQVVCRDVEDYGRIHRDHLAELPGVDRIRSSFALRSVETNGGPVWGRSTDRRQRPN